MSIESGLFFQKKFALAKRAQWRYNSLMKKILAALIVVVCSAAVFAKTFSGDDVNNCLNDFSRDLNKSLPNAASQQNVYAQAWIGKVFPSAPPHLAVGIEASATKLDLSALGNFAEIFKVNGIPKTFVYPMLTANARVGGFVLPFDIGFSCMYMNFSNLKAAAEGFGIKFFNIGGDVRYALLKGEGAWPQLSLGFGYYFINGKVSLDKDGVKAGVDYSSHTMFGQVQLSKTFLFFTPYVGFRGIFSKNSTDWAWSATDKRISDAASYVGAAASGKGNASSNWGDNFIPQIYGGFGLKISFLAINIAGAYDFKNSIWNGNFSLRFQM